MTQAFRQGEIYRVNFSPSVGHEYKKERPAVIIQSDEQLRKSSLMTVMPFTSKLANRHGDDILVRKDKTNNLYADSLIKVHSIVSYDKSRFIGKIGRVSNETVAQIKAYVKKHFGV